MGLGNRDLRRGAAELREQLTGPLLCLTALVCSARQRLAGAIYKADSDQPPRELLPANTGVEGIEKAGVDCSAQRSDPVAEDLQVWIHRPAAVRSKLDEAMFIRTMNVSDLNLISGLLKTWT